MKFLIVVMSFIWSIIEYLILMTWTVVKGLTPSFVGLYLTLYLGRIIDTTVNVEELSNIQSNILLITLFIPIVLGCIISLKYLSKKLDIYESSFLSRYNKNLTNAMKFFKYV